MSRPEAERAPRKNDGDWTQRVTVDRNVLVLFTRQMAIMLGTGVPITHALDTLSVQVDHPNFGEVVTTMAERIASGHSFSSSAAMFPKIFPKVYITMLAIGERTGAMDSALDRLADWLEKDLATFQKVKSALTYPGFVLGLTALLTAGLFYTVLPGFVGVFEDMGSELPLITKMVLGLTKAARNPGIWLLTLGGLASGIFILRQYMSTESGAVAVAERALDLPVLGHMLSLASNARFSSGMATLLDSGQDLPRSLMMAAEASQNPVLVRDAKLLADGIMEGVPLSEQMQMMGKTYPPVLRQMIVAGEEASNLAVMFEKAAAFFAAEVDYRLEAVSAALEPLLLFLVGSVVGTIIMSIFIPLYGTLNQL